MQKLKRNKMKLVYNVENVSKGSLLFGKLTKLVYNHIVEHIKPTTQWNSIK